MRIENLNPQIKNLSEVDDPTENCYTRATKYKVGEKIKHLEYNNIIESIIFKIIQAENGRIAYVTTPLINEENLLGYVVKEENIL